ncbi:MAG TPA: imidazole glycerol phosphate synthase subunit HisH [Candidatus Limnocylindrales bacterium]|nr:imidazole glycerol phosphate synthase subunit HisH [Candidatus Limnocylindrales bacterium]
MIRIAVADYGAGNLVSIARALEVVGAEPVLVRDAEALRGTDALIVPGVGAAAPAMERLRRRALVEPIRTWIADGRPYLGICLGLQLLFAGSDEDGAATLGILGGRTIKLADAPTLPHIGWNTVEVSTEAPLFSGIASGTAFYFVHSYVAAPDDRTTVIAQAEHGSRFPAAIARDNLLGVQFHPERSGVDGLRLLANFAAIAAGTPRAGTSRTAAAVLA